MVLFVFYFPIPSIDYLLFNSLDKLQTKPLPPIRHICGLEASVGCERVERTFNAPRLKSQICLIGGNGFCAVAGEGELNRGRIWGWDAISSTYSRRTGNRGYDLICLYAIVKWRNRHFKFDFINIAEHNIIIAPNYLKSSIVSNQ